MAHSLSVVIATTGRPTLLGRTLASLAACEMPAIYRETIVVENGSRAGAEDVTHTFHSALNTRYFHVEQASKSLALNCVLETISDGLVFFTDDDVRFDAGVLSAYAKASEGTDRGQFYGGPVRADYEQEPPSWLKLYLPYSAKGWGLSGEWASEKYSFFVGFNWAAFVQDITEAGGYDQTLGPGSPVCSVGDEEDMEQRLLNRGVQQVFVPGAVVWHYVPKERCSAKWALKRAYKQGILVGLKQRKESLEKPRFHPSMAKKWLQKGVRAARYTFQRDASMRFEAYYRLAHYTGFCKGIAFIAHRAV